MIAIIAHMPRVFFTDRAFAETIPLQPNGHGNGNGHGRGNGPRAGDGSGQAAVGRAAVDAGRPADDSPDG